MIFLVQKYRSVVVLAWGRPPQPVPPFLARFERRLGGPHAHGIRPRAHGPPCARAPVPTWRTVRTGLPCARASQAETTLIYISFIVRVPFSLSICTCPCLSSVDSPNRQVFIRRK